MVTIRWQVSRWMSTQPGFSVVRPYQFTNNRQCATSALLSFSCDDLDMPAWRWLGTYCSTYCYHVDTFTSPLFLFSIADLCTIIGRKKWKTTIKTYRKQHGRRCRLRVFLCVLPPSHIFLWHLWVDFYAFYLVFWAHHHVWKLLLFELLCQRHRTGIRQWHSFFWPHHYSLKWS